MDSGPAQINRLNRSRNVTLEVELSGKRSLGEVNEEARALPTMKNLPPSVKIAELGDTQEMAGAVRQLRPRHADRRGLHLLACWCCCSRTSCSR